MFMFLNYAQNAGKVFEKNIHEMLSKTRHSLLMNETEIRRQDSTITAIDHLLIINNNIYCFQDKLISTAVSNSTFNHFIKCVDNLASKFDKSYNIYAVYISSSEFSSISLKQLNSENEKYTNNQSNIQYIKIINTDKYELINTVRMFLYSHGIFIYDNDGDCDMV